MIIASAVIAVRVHSQSPPSERQSQPGPFSIMRLAPRAVNTAPCSNPDMVTVEAGHMLRYWTVAQDVE